MKYSMIKNQTKKITSRALYKTSVPSSQLKRFSNLSETQEVQGLKDFKDVSHHETFLVRKNNLISNLSGKRHSSDQDFHSHG
jgi:hypothetical protein